MANIRLRAGKTATPLRVLQMFSAAFLATICLLTIVIVALKIFYQWEPEQGSVLAGSPVYTLALAGVCLALSFALPQLIINSSRAKIKKEHPKEQSEDMSFVLVPAIFARYLLLFFVTVIGFVIAFAEGGGLMIFVPFAAVSFALMGIYFPTESRLRAWLH